MFSDTPLDRLNHALGKSYADLARMWLRQVPHVPDWVAYPDDEQAVIDILDWASRHNVAVIPYGGGSSVCGGVKPLWAAVMQRPCRWTWSALTAYWRWTPPAAPPASRPARWAPELEAQLAAWLHLAPLPAELRFSTLGGWIVTRAGGHYATLMTHIDDLVEKAPAWSRHQGVRPRRLPASGAGPSQDRMVLGSGGYAGRGHRGLDAPAGASSLPRQRHPCASPTTNKAQCVRPWRNRGLYPSNCRLLDPMETVFSGVGDGSAARWCWASNQPITR